MAQISLKSLSELFFFQLMNDKNIDSQSESCFKELERLKRQTTKLQLVLRINSTILCVGVDTNIVIIIVNILGVNRPLHYNSLIIFT